MNEPNWRANESSQTETRRRSGARWAGLLAVAAIALTVAWALHASVVAQGTGQVQGVVLKQEGGSAVGATVRQQSKLDSVTTASDGRFTLRGLEEGESITVTAWLDGYYVGWQVVTPTVSGVSITVRPYPTTDNEDYHWFSSTDPEEGISCLHCMVAYPEWVAGAHGQSAINPRFFSMYNGTDVTATGVISPGYKLDFPGTAGNCATCHAPGAATRRQGAFTADMNELRPGAEQEGVFCEFCHKIGDVYLNPATGLPYSNAPGVLSYRLHRTFDPDVLFLGPLDDVTRRVSYLPLEKQSQFCAPCHQFGFWGTPIYQSFEEWLNSDYPSQGIECQTCHMPPGELPYFVYPEHGGLIRDPSTLASHLDLGVKDSEFMQGTVSMTLHTNPSHAGINVTVAITNVFAGHHVPTDYPGRNMILVLSAKDERGQLLGQLSGPVVPDWGGTGGGEVDYGGLPGKGYAKILRDAVTGDWPVVNYWKPTFIHSDNRIPARACDVSQYRFALPNDSRTGALPNDSRTGALPNDSRTGALPNDGRTGALLNDGRTGALPDDGRTGARLASGNVTIEAQLWFRRLFIDMAREKGWDTPDILMAQARVEVAAAVVAPLIYLPVIARG